MLLPLERELAADVGCRRMRSPRFTASDNQKGIVMLGTVVIVILILMLVGALPRWSHSASWGYAPSGMLGTILIVLLILVLLGKL